MKLSRNTLDVLKNFSTINPSILFLEGNKQKTITPVGTTCYAAVTLEEEFPREFGVADLNKFLGVFSLFEDPELEFGEYSVTFSEGKRKASFRYAAPETIRFPPKDKNVAIGDVLEQYEISSDDLKSLFRATALYGQDMLSFEGDGENTILRTIDPEEKGSDGASLVLGQTTKKFRYVVTIENMKIMNGHDYDILITSKKLIVMKSKTTDLMYAVGPQAKFTQPIGE